jgi:hypothetical protein
VAGPSRKGKVVNGGTEAVREGVEVGCHVEMLSLQPLVDGHQDRLLKMLTRFHRSKLG